MEEMEKIIERIIPGLLYTFLSRERGGLPARQEMCKNFLEQHNTPYELLDIEEVEAPSYPAPEMIKFGRLHYLDGDEMEMDYLQPKVYVLGFVQDNDETKCICLYKEGDIKYLPPKEIEVYATLRAIEGHTRYLNYPPSDRV